MRIYNADAVRAALRESPLEKRFAQRWQQRYPDLPFERELEFIPRRKFRGDFCWASARVVAECQGGIWASQRSGHSTGAAIERDATKLCLASLNGWVIFPLTERMIGDDELLDGIAQFIRDRQEAE